MSLTLRHTHVEGVTALATLHSLRPEGERTSAAKIKTCDSSLLMDGLRSDTEPYAIQPRSNPDQREQVQSIE